MRIKLSAKNRKFLFKKVAETVNLGIVAKKLKVSHRTIRDWRAGRNLLSETGYRYLCGQAMLSDERMLPEFRKEYWQTKRAGKLGGKKAAQLYGNPGTVAGRKRGGVSSLVVHKKLKTGFLLAKIIKRPKRSKGLAEFLGLLFGDGHAGGFQISVTTNSETDYDHALFVKNLIEKLFGIKAKLSKRKDAKAVTIVASSRKLVDFVSSLGMPLGNKIHSGISVPKWIFSSIRFQKAFLRGLFDTDGCIYVEKHVRDEKIYRYVCLAITSYSFNLRAGIIQIFRNLGFSPTHRPTQKSVFLRRSGEIKKYFKNVGSSNNKHIRRYHEFTGEVAELV